MYLYYWDTEPAIKRLKARRDGCTLDITLETGEKISVDMSGVMEQRDPLGPLADPKIFASAKITAGGDGVKFGHQDRMIGADTLVRMAEEQRPFKGRDLAEWRRRMNITADEAGALLGYSARHIRNLEKLKGNVPAPVAIAVRAMTADPAIYAAHHRPKRPWRAERTETQESAQPVAAAKTNGKAKANGKAKPNGKTNGKTNQRARAESKTAARPALKQRSDSAHKKPALKQRSDSAHKKPAPVKRRRAGNGASAGA